MNKPRRLALLTVSTLLFCSEGAAQQRPPRPPASDFNIELINLGARSFVSSVPGPGVRSGYVAHGDLRRIPAWKPFEEVAAEVSALRVEYWLEEEEEEAVRVEVTAYLGQSEPYSRPSDWEKLKTTKVASRLVHADETIGINETERFGIEPFTVKVMRAGLWNGPAEIINKTQALTITSTAEERPLYKVAVRNVSHKFISAIRWYALENGRRAAGSGLSGVGLIAAGGAFEIRQHFDLAEDSQAEGPQRKPLKRKLVIAAIVFEDGSFEGEADAAAEMAAALTGERTQLLRAIKLLQSVSSPPREDLPTTLSQLKRDIASLGEDVDPELVNELSSRFAAASQDTRKRRIKEEIQNALRFVKSELLHEIEKFEYRREHSPEDTDFEAWLNEVVKNLEAMSGS